MKYQVIALRPSAAVNGGEVMKLHRTAAIVGRIIRLQCSRKSIFLGHYSAHVWLRIPVEAVLYLLSGDYTNQQKQPQELPDSAARVTGLAQIGPLKSSGPWQSKRCIHIFLRIVSLPPPFDTLTKFHDSWQLDLSDNDSRSEFRTDVGPFGPLQSTGMTLKISALKDSPFNFTYSMQLATDWENSQVCALLRWWQHFWREPISVGCGCWSTRTGIAEASLCHLIRDHQWACRMAWNWSDITALVTWPHRVLCNGLVRWQRYSCPVLRKKNNYLLVRWCWAVPPSRPRRYWSSMSGDILGSLLAAAVPNYGFWQQDVCIHFKCYYSFGTKSGISTSTRFLIYSIIVAVRVNEGLDVRRVRAFADIDHLFRGRLFSCNAVMSKPDRFNDIRQEPTQGLVDKYNRTYYCRRPRSLFSD